MQAPPKNILHYLKDPPQKQKSRTDPAALLVSVLSQAMPAQEKTVPDCNKCQDRPAVEQIIEGNGNVQIVSHVPERQIIRGNGNLQADLIAWLQFMQRSP